MAIDARSMIDIRAKDVDAGFTRSQLNDSSASGELRPVGRRAGRSLHFDAEKTMKRITWDTTLEI